MINPSTFDAVPRLRLTTAGVGTAELDGGWWPTSWNASIELPGLIAALADRFGAVDRVALNTDAWDSRFRRLGTGPDATRMAWSDTLDPALLIAALAVRVTVRLVVIPPDSSPTVAARAMEAAAHHANKLPAAKLLAAARNQR